LFFLIYFPFPHLTYSTQNDHADRFLPKFKKQNTKPSNKKALPSKKKTRTLFPPAPAPRKIDLQLESGEYFMTKGQKVQAEIARKKEVQGARSDARRAEREKGFVAPLEE
jgi:ribosomal RNA assembly protein